MPSYEYPFNERIRTFLRLEDLFVKVLHHVQKEHEFNHHSALIYIFQILDVIDRAELKTDLLQELDRQKILMNNLRGNPSISENILSDIISEIETVSTSLRADASKLGQILRDNDWLMSIKQRAGIPGGVCEFDVPSYHYWLGFLPARRAADLNAWLTPLLPIHHAIRIILHILRGSGNAVKITAPNGAFQQMLGNSKPAQLLKIELSDELACFPEVSANKYALNIRFFALDLTAKPKAVDNDVEFSFTLCSL